MKSKLKGMVLTKKEEELLHYLHAVKVSSYQRIKRDIYPSYHIRSVCNRIYRLEDNHLVRGECNRSINGGERTLSLTNKGFTEYVAQGIESRSELSSESVLHDLNLGDIRSRLLKAKKVSSYYTENQIQTWGISGFERRFTSYVNLNSDAMVEIQFSSGNQLIPLELEMHLKAKDRYEQLLKRYYQRDDVVLILYICANQNILNKVREMEMTLFKSEQPKFLYKLKQDFDADAYLEFTNCNGKSLRLDNP